MLMFTLCCCEKKGRCTSKNTDKHNRLQWTGVLKKQLFHGGKEVCFPRLNGTLVLTVTTYKLTYMIDCNKLLLVF